MSEKSNINEQIDDSLQVDASPEIQEEKKAKVILFTSPTCPNCPPAKEFIGKFSKKRRDFELINYSTMDKEGHLKAMEFQIRSVPTFIIQGPAIDENIGLIGTQGEWVMNKYLDKALGLNGKKEKSKLEKKKEDKKDSIDNEDISKPKNRVKKEFKIGKFRIKF